MANNCVWSDNAVALEIWSRLAVLAFNADNHALVMECGKKALAFHQENKKNDKGNSKPRYFFNVVSIKCKFFLVKLFNLIFISPISKYCSQRED